MTVPQPQPTSEAQDRMRVIAGAAALAHQFRPLATPTSKSWLDFGTENLPFAIALTFNTTSTTTAPAAYAWQMTVCWQDGTRRTVSICDLTNNGDAAVFPWWGSEAGTYLATLRYALDRMIHECQRVGCEAFLARGQGAGKAAA